MRLAVWCGPVSPADAMLTMRMIGQNDYSVRENAQPIGRIHFASERTPGIWLWNVTVNIPGPRSALTLDEAKAAFRTAWEGFKEKHGPDRLAAAFNAMNVRKT